MTARDVLTLAVAVVTTAGLLAIYFLTMASAFAR